MDRRLIALGAFAAVLAVTVVVVLVARGGGDSNGGSVSTDTSSKPEPAPPGGDPPSELGVEDVVEGDGDTAGAGDRVEVQYVGVDFDSGEEFDSSWDAGEPLTFELGAGEVISGWEEGVEGMRAGGRRQLVVPPDLAYGAQGQPPSIGPNATLVFVVDLVSIE